MFDTVAAPRREDRARRAGSLLLSALLLGSLLGLALTWVPPAALPEAVLPPMPVLVELRAPELADEVHRCLEAVEAAREHALGMRA